MLFGISLKEYLSNFLWDFFFFADFVEQSNSWLNTVVYMIRLNKHSEGQYEGSGIYLSHCMTWGVQ
jgi:hypothetical protein